MSVTIKAKLPLSIGADPKKLAAIGLCKSHGVIFPLSEGGDAKNKELIEKLGKAKKHERKLLKKYKASLSKGIGAIKKAAKTYLSNKRCLLVSLFEDNKRREMQDRLSLDQMIALSHQYDILKSLPEPAKIWTEPKSSGNGERVICCFGPVARAAQRMVVKLLRMTYQPQRFQYSHLGSAQKVQRAVSLIKTKGCTHALEIDIKDFFPSFSEEDLIAALPLPSEAVKHIVMAKSAEWRPCYSHLSQSYIVSPPGTPQGSASSAEVAHWCIANMSLKKIEGVDVINHADNFFAFAMSQSHKENAAKALNSGLAGLSGGDFIGETEQACEIVQGFRMLGCKISLDKSDGLIIDPTETNWKKLSYRMRRQKDRAYAKLTKASAEGQTKLRIEGLQEYLRLESIGHGWIQAFSFCGPHIKCVEEEVNLDLELIRHVYEITPEELKPLKDASTVVNIKWYSG